MIGKTLEHYEIQSRLGQGGMGEVYRARDTKLGRDVALKVLHPHMAGNEESRQRFMREAKTVASLRHPNIVTIYSVEESQGHLFLTMELLEGHTLDRFIPQGGLGLQKFSALALPLTEALAAAHQKGVTHRDLKPSNVMIEENGTVKILDFGLAKLLEQDVGDETVDMHVTTGEGRVLGTITYMSPEQAEGKAVDSRSDIFSLGILFYEMLTGVRPFKGESKLSVLTSILRDDPALVTELNRALPEDLGRIVRQCLEKDPDRRFQSALDIRNELSTLAGSTTGQSVSIQPVSSASRAKSSSRLSAFQPQKSWWGIMLGYGAVAAVMFFMVRFLIGAVGLPDWVLPVAVVLLALGLPILLVAGRKPGSFLTWRRAVMGGVLAFAGLGVVTVGYFVSREMGIGPAASLVSAGILDKEEQILISEFTNNTDDPFLGDAVREAFLIDFSQSELVTVVPSNQVGQVLRRMGMPPDTSLVSNLAREVAVREGIKAVVEGEIIPLGSETIISAKLVQASDGQVLAASRASAVQEQSIIGAVDEVSAKLREQIGESLKVIRGNKPLEDVSTPSLAALQKYTQAIQIADFGDNYDLASSLLEEAIALDPEFAMAYRKLAILLNNRGIDQARQNELLTTAYQLRHRLTDRERYVTEASYFSTVMDDVEEAIRVYERMLDQFPGDMYAHNNISLRYTNVRRFDDALRHARYTYEQFKTVNGMFNYGSALLNVGDYAGYDSLEADFREHNPESAAPNMTRAFRLSSEHRYAEAEEYAKKALEGVAGILSLQAEGMRGLRDILFAQGRVQDARGTIDDMVDLQRSQGWEANALGSELSWAWALYQLADDSQASLAETKRAVEDVPLSTLEAADAPYDDVVMLLALNGEPETARELLAEFEGRLDETLQSSRKADVGYAHSAVYVAEERFDEALAELGKVKWNRWGWPDAYKAHILDLAGRTDEAIEEYERAVLSPNPYRIRVESAVVFFRLGELYEAKEDWEKAALYYSRFLSLWENADPILQPKVKEAERRLASLLESVQ